MMFEHEEQTGASGGCQETGAGQHRKRSMEAGP